MTQLTNQLIARFNQGYPDAFKTVFDSYRMRIFYFVVDLIKDRPAAEEITSDTFIKLYHYRENYTTQYNIQAFLFITAKNASFDFLKTSARYQERLAALQNILRSQEAEIPRFSETDIEAEILQFINGEIEKLPEQCRRIFKYFYFDGLSVSKIANTMNLSPQTVSNQKLTALKTLRIKVFDNPELLIYLLITFKKMYSG